ncbi:MAG TPA: hypothetical protein VF331_19780 [Polyangiales bacterium]
MIRASLGCALVVACAPLLGCDAALLSPARAFAQDTPADVFSGTALRQDFILEQLASAATLVFRPVGSTSTVFRTTLRSTIGAAFKAATVRRPYGPQSEVASYRLARCLGLSNVPPAVLRWLPTSTLHAGLDSEHAREWPEIAQRLVIGHDDKVLGAAIYWVEGMRDTGLESSAGQARVAAWHNVALPLPQDDAGLAADASTMVAFDYLIGNWDRWSGGNVKADASGRHLYLRDHDAGLPLHLSEALHRRMLERLVQTQRFSRAFYTALRALSRETYRRELERDPGFAAAELFDTRRIAGLFDRRATLLSHISALIDEHGADQVLVFP